MAAASDDTSPAATVPPPDHDRSSRPPADSDLAVHFAASQRTLARSVLRPVDRFLDLEVASGVFLVLAAVVALVWANSPLRDSYERLWETHLLVEMGAFHLDESLRHWVNDGLMAIFFAVVGMEIKREMVHGHLRDARAALLPVLAAAGGMVVPALVFTALNVGGAGSGGWGVPMATDIAFAVGVLTLAGKRVPSELKIFLLSIAVADDIGAIVVIALFYSSGVSLAWLAGALAALGLIALANRLDVRHLGPYLVLAVAAWLCLLESGIHATLAGVSVGLLTPTRPFHRATAAAGAIRSRLDQLGGERSLARSDDAEHDQTILWNASRIAREGVSPLFRVEDFLSRWSAFVILPVFALANAGVEISGDGLSGAGASNVALGVALGLLVGKPLGIFGASMIAVRLGVGRLPAGATNLQVLGVGILGGVGFTVALFVAGLAFTDAALTEASKVGILGGSLLAAIVGWAVLRLAPSRAG